MKWGDICINLFGLRQQSTMEYEQQNCIAHSSGSWKVQHQGAANLVSGKNPPFWFRVGTFPMCSLMVEKKAEQFPQPPHPLPTLTVVMVVTN